MSRPSFGFWRIGPHPSDKLLNQESLVAKLREQAIGQEAVIELVSAVLKKLAVQNQKPLVILIPCPLGSDKPAIAAEALAEALETKLFRFYLEVYGESYSSRELFGCTKGYLGSELGGELPNALRHSKGRCILLLDEIEHSPLSLWPKLLAFFNQGSASDMLGTAIAPKETICLLTTSVLDYRISENPKAAAEILKQSGCFSLELLERIDQIIPFFK